MVMTLMRMVGDGDDQEDDGDYQEDDDDYQVRWHRDCSRSSLTSVSPEPTTARLISTLTALQVSTKFHKYKV